MPNFKMQLISKNASREHYLETQPILSLPDINQTDDEVSGCEIRTVSLDSSSNDETENLENNVSLVIEDTPQCRICLDAGDESLIAPCYCKGTQKYVHRSCLDNWRSTKEGFAFSHCTECRALFPLRANVPPDRRWLRLKFQFLVARDHALIFVVVQLILHLRVPKALNLDFSLLEAHMFLNISCYILLLKTQTANIPIVQESNRKLVNLRIVALLGVLVYKFYGMELREMFGYEEHPYAFYIMAVLSIVLVGLLYGFFIAIICGQRINERHYNVLAKQELTKEYIVEDRDTKGVPELDPSHVSELRTLGLY
ncbi:unnamed protein product [Rhodiola kirilowii]